MRRQAFQRIDLNNDGMISKKEMQHDNSRVGLPVIGSLEEQPIQEEAGERQHSGTG